MDESVIPDYRSLLDLSGQRHVVLGAGQGIGRQAACAYASVGAEVVCVDIDADRAGQVARETGGVAAVADVVQSGAVGSLFDEVAGRYGRIDGMTNVVGVARFGELADITDEDWEWQHSIVARQAFWSLRAAVPHLRRAGGGSLTFVTSVAALTSAPAHGVYGMSKSAIMSMVRTAAVELGPVGIRVNSVAPGTTRTPRMTADDQFETTLTQTALRTPLRRVGEPSDVAAALLFLASGLAAHISGQNLVVDGGLSQTYPVAGREDE